MNGLLWFWLVGGLTMAVSVDPEPEFHGWERWFFFLLAVVAGPPIFVAAMLWKLWGWLRGRSDG